MPIRFIQSRFDKGHAAWEVEVPFHGKRERKYEMTEEQAKQSEKEMLARLDLGRKIVLQNLNQAINEYYKTVSKKKVSHKHERRYLTLLSKYFESKKLVEVHEVKHKHLMGMQDWLQENHRIKLDEVDEEGKQKFLDFKAICPSTVNRYFSCYRDFFGYCMKNEYMEKNPCDYLDPLDFDAETREPASPDNYAHYYAECPDYFKDPAECLYLTGWRPITLAKFNWEHVHFDRGYVDYSTLKGFKGKIRWLKFPLIPELESLLKRQAEKQRFMGIMPIGKSPVFLNSEGRRYTASRISKIGNAAIKRAGLIGLVQYSMRYALADDLKEAGVDLEKISKLLGHSATRMTEHYAGDPSISSLAKVLSTVRSNTATSDLVANLPQMEVGAT